MSTGFRPDTQGLQLICTKALTPVLCDGHLVRIYKTVRLNPLYRTFGFEVKLIFESEHSCIILLIKNTLQ
ncbi:hypothetical protein D3H65_24035 [Paraflavitalea soli]|uniref:Uncharacterized protein n=1 Tax=Paraflavitalea soli TaxID=2315862 RepID=A0A3B7MQV5_9BACT|nr:hypothetical protein D3H65_24035 [Paraflavitalea soli]